MSKINMHKNILMQLSLLILLKAAILLFMTIALNLFSFIFLAFVVPLLNCRCMYDLDWDTQLPFHTDRQPFDIPSNLTACKDFLEPGRKGCCSPINDLLTLKNFKQIDGVFSSQSGGCDICAINLKRFWCQYACSDRQHDFMWTDDKMKPYPDPQKPGAMIMGQEVWATVHSDTACAIFQSCKRVPFVSSVSALGSPAGFLNFQGHNALNDAHQYISFNFSNDLNKSLAFSNSFNDFPYEDLMTCNYKTNESLVHNLTFTQNCTCNTCELACDASQGFVYSPPDILEGFNYKLVGGTYLFVGLVVAGVSVYRKLKSNQHRKRH